MVDGGGYAMVDGYGYTMVANTRLCAMVDYGLPCHHPISTIVAPHHHDIMSTVAHPIYIMSKRTPYVLYLFSVILGE
jgi:hypothetical protein